LGIQSKPVYFYHLGDTVELPQSITLWGASISLYGICLAVAAIFGIIITVCEAKRRKYEAEEYLIFLCIVFAFGVLGARFFYILFRWDYFLPNPLEMIDFRTGGMSFYGAVFGVWIALRRYCRTRKIEEHKVLDALCVAASIAAIPVWAGCAFQGEPQGIMSKGFFTVGIKTETLLTRCPQLGSAEVAEYSFLYEHELYTTVVPVAMIGLVLSVLAAIVIVVARLFVKTDGVLFLHYMFLTAVIQLVVDLFSIRMCHFFSFSVPINSIVSVVLILSVLGHLGSQIVVRKRNKKR